MCCRTEGESEFSSGTSEDMASSPFAVDCSSTSSTANDAAGKCGDDVCMSWFSRIFWDGLEIEVDGPPVCSRKEVWCDAEPTDIDEGAFDWEESRRPAAKSMSNDADGSAGDGLRVAS